MLVRVHAYYEPCGAWQTHQIIQNVVEHKAWTRRQLSIVSLLFSCANVFSESSPAVHGPGRRRYCGIQDVREHWWIDLTRGEVGAFSDPRARVTYY